MSQTDAVIERSSSSAAPRPTAAAPGGGGIVGGGRGDDERRQRPRGRAAVAVVLVVALALTAVTNQLTQWRRDVATRTTARPVAAAAAAQVSGNPLSAMPSYATALLLGGLRGPLVMILWTTSENQKQEHNLQDFDTKVEWIRLLQPEFDTVHLFQIWNKAYNISAQMASLSNKYQTILDGIDYAHKVDQEKPDDINIISQIGALYADKLGTSSEHAYYRRRVRKETQQLVRLTMPQARADEFRNVAASVGWSEDESPIGNDDKSHTSIVMLEHNTAEALRKVFAGEGVKYEPQRAGSERHAPGWRRVRMDPVLDADGNLLPELLAPRYARPSNVPADEPYYDGSELGVLKAYEPFPYGVSTMALAYAYHKRAQLLQNQWNEHHIQTSDQVIDSRPALTLKEWANDEWERGRRAEIRLAHKTAGSDRSDLELPSADARFDEPGIDPVTLSLALYSYDLAARLFADARAGYEAHLRNFSNNITIYQSHIDECNAGEQLLKGDAAYLRATTASDPAARAAAQAAARDAYVKSNELYALTCLRYYMDETVCRQLFPTDPATNRQYTKSNLDQLDPRALVPLLNACLIRSAELAHAHGGYDQFASDRDEFLNYLKRGSARLQILGLPTTMPAVTTAPAGK